MQRLPPHRIQRAQELGEIGFEENPAAAGLCTGDEAALRPGADLLGVHAQERGGLVEVERSFSDSLRAEHAQLLSAHDPGPRFFPTSKEPSAAMQLSAQLVQLSDSHEAVCAGLSLLAATRAASGAGSSAPPCVTRPAAFQRKTQLAARDSDRT